MGGESREHARARARARFTVSIIISNVLIWILPCSSCFSCVLYSVDVLFSAQMYPHTSFTQGVDFLQTMFTGSAYVHGPLNSDHWYTYVTDDGRRPTSAAADRTRNMMIYNLEPEVARINTVVSSGRTRIRIHTVYRASPGVLLLLCRQEKQA